MQIQMISQTKEEKEVSKKMMMVLMDWLTDVSIHMDLKFETLHLAAFYLHKFLHEYKHNDIKVSKFNLQLVGTAAIKIADCFF